MVISPSRESVGQGEVATFTCSVYGDDDDDDVTTAWSRDNLPLDDLRVCDTKAKFIIYIILG